MGTLLTVDWDFFFPCPDPGDPDWQFFDWGHNEGWPPGLSASLWLSRAANFVRNGMPLLGLSGKQEGFWDRFHYAPDCELFYSDSHRQAVDEAVANGITEVILFDAHHDCGYPGKTITEVRASGKVDCSDWMVAYAMWGAALRVFYPEWRSQAFALEPKPRVPVKRRYDRGWPVKGLIERVHVCRSGSWVPPWLDPQFDQFIYSGPFADITRMPDYEEREWDPSGPEEHARALDALREMTESLEREGQG